MWAKLYAWSGIYCVALFIIMIGSFGSSQLIYLIQATAKLIEPPNILCWLNDCLCFIHPNSSIHAISYLISNADKNQTRRIRQLMLKCNFGTANLDQFHNCAVHHCSIQIHRRHSSRNETMSINFVVPAIFQHNNPYFDSSYFKPFNDPNRRPIVSVLNAFLQWKWSCQVYKHSSTWA